MGTIRHFYTKAVGVTKPNEDGTDRQEIIARCSAGESLLLEHDPDNPYDSDAVKVCREDGTQIGFLRAELAADLVHQGLDKFLAFASDITGGPPTFGVNILLLVHANASEDELAEYLKREVVGEGSSATAPAGSGCLGAIAITFLLVSWTWLKLS